MDDGINHSNARLQADRQTEVGPALDSTRAEEEQVGGQSHRSVAIEVFGVWCLLNQYHAGCLS